VSTVERGGHVYLLTAPGAGLAPQVKRLHLALAEQDAFFAYEEDFLGGLFVAGG
jgi:hypothetical protein